MSELPLQPREPVSRFEKELQAKAPVSRFERELRDNARRIAPLVSAQRLWDRLTPTEQQQLGNDLVAAYALYGTAGMWVRLRGVSARRAVVDVAAALDLITPETRRWLLRELGEVHDDPDEAIAAAVATGGLVLVERPRTAYWAGADIPVEWQRRTALWDYLWKLAQCGKSGCAIDPSELGAEGPPDAAVKLKSRLINLPGFPPDLAQHIHRADRGAQRLDLPPQQIRLFEMSTLEVAREWTT